MACFLKWIVVFFGVLNSLVSAAPELHVANWKKIMARLPDDQRKAVYMTASVFHGDVNSSGVFVSPYHVLTTVHAVKTPHCETMTIKTLVGAGGAEVGPKGIETGCKQILAIDREFDMMLLRIKSRKPYPHFARLGPDSEPDGRHLNFISTGYVIDNYFAISQDCVGKWQRGDDNPLRAIEDGYVSVNEKNLFKGDCHLDRGMSGGPAFTWENGLPVLWAINGSIMISPPTARDLDSGFRANANFHLVTNLLNAYTAEFDEVRAEVTAFETRYGRPTP